MAVKVAAANVVRVEVMVARVRVEAAREVVTVARGGRRW